MEQFVTRMLARHGYTVDAATFKDLESGEWVTWVKDHQDGEWFVIGRDERFVVLESTHSLYVWLGEHLR